MSKFSSLVSINSLFWFTLILIVINLSAKYMIHEGNLLLLVKLLKLRYLLMRCNIYIYIAAIFLSLIVLLFLLFVCLQVHGDTSHVFCAYVMLVFRFCGHRKFEGNFDTKFTKLIDEIKKKISRLEEYSR